MNKAFIGFPIGLMVGLIICVILFKIANTNKKIKSEYDERQEAIRNRGYKYSFYALIVAELALMCARALEITFPFADYLLHLGAMLFGLLFLGIYTIWNDAYWGMNNNRKRYTVIIVIAVLLNILPVVMAVKNGFLGNAGLNSVPIMNIMVLVWLAIIGIAAVIKKIVKKNDAEEEE
ncbi:MAG: hypothetical protein IJ589_10850 [Lachnospiraceae bacterium]|nr:hypothetical protein [Lachnospiraceae bacterium]